MKTHLLALLFLFTGFTLFAQEKTVTGTVTSADDGMPLPGANVSVKGSTTGTTTDFDGIYEIVIEEGDVLTFSYIGFVTQEVSVDGQDTIDVSLKPDLESLSEVVVVGYGEQKREDLTGSIATIDSEEIQKTPNSNVMQSVQGKVPGVQIVSAGSPGASPTVRIRGLGSFNSGSSSVLYVVDGAFYNNIDFLDSKDIKSINVLKDASSAAIYGVRAANGVVIIETKKGTRNKKPVIEYDTYTGIQVAQNVLKMANSEQFATMAYESGSEADVQFILNAMQRYGRSDLNPNVPAVNTDWYNEILREGIITSHGLSVTGGGEKSTYSVGVNYFDQEGILDMKNEYERLNLRSKLDLDVTDRVKVGSSFIFSNATQYAPENSAWFKAYHAVPVMPVYDDQNTEATPYSFSNAQILGYRGTQNPFPDMVYNKNHIKIRKILANIYAETELIKDKLTFKTSYSHDYSTIEGHYINLPFNLGNNAEGFSSIRREQNNYSNQYWDNTLTYEDSFGDHNLTLLAGHSFRDEAANTFNATGRDIKGISLETSQYLDFADPTSFSGNVGENAARIYGLSFFGRAQYNYASKYLLYGTLRYDGSSKFTKDPWGLFPSVGTGWVISKEDFLNDSNTINFLKLRASWGQLGNDNVASSSGSNTINNVYAIFGQNPFVGYTSSSVFTDNEWELVEEFNFGLDSEFLNNKLSVNADYFIRDTENAILPITIPVINRVLEQNAGTIRNQGLELSANWTDNINEDFSYSIGGNFTTIKNEVTYIDNEQGYINSGSAEFRQRTVVGEALQSFYGLEVVGVFQNDAQVGASPFLENNPEAQLQPGDLIFKDQNNDGVINDEDRVFLGSFLPKFTYGGNLNVNYKNWDLSLSIYGQGGNKILNRKRGEIIFTNDTNMDADLAINRWHGEGTSNSYPSSAGLRKSWNQQLSDFWIEDGDFFRIQNFQVGYTINSTKLPEIRLNFTAERPLTFFKYNGFTPEITDGVDRQTYPIPAVYTVGLNVKI
ncbi:MAG: TonB-dependent receptor [Mesonia sp.]|uniref:SusC/RagA family TonB-linked outer membrane protein n=1 Tax=Mesonia sp. TaxID=1960830 RepID=UPI003241F9B9